MVAACPSPSTLFLFPLWPLVPVRPRLLVTLLLQGHLLLNSINMILDSVFEMVSEPLLILKKILISVLLDFAGFLKLVENEG